MKINILEMKLTTLITTDEDSCQITKELMFKAFERILHFNNVVINLINYYKNVYLHLRYNTERQKKITTFEVLNNFRYYVILDASDQNRILKENLTDEDIASQSSIQTWIRYKEKQVWTENTERNVLSKNIFEQMKHMKETLAKKSIKLEVREKITLWKLMFRKAREEIRVCFWVCDRTEEIIEFDEETFALFKSWVEIRKDSDNKSKQYRT